MRTKDDEYRLAEMLTPGKCPEESEQSIVVHDTELNKLREQLRIFVPEEYHQRCLERFEGYWHQAMHNGCGEIVSSGAIIALVMALVRDMVLVGINKEIEYETGMAMVEQYASKRGGGTTH